MNAFLNTLAGAALLLASMPGSAATLSVYPASSTVTLGSSVNVALNIAGLGDHTAPSLSTFDLDLGFDPAILSYSSAVFGGPVLGDQLDLFGLGFGVGSVFWDTPAPGTVKFFEVSLDSIDDLNSLQAGSFTLLTLTFDTIGIGNSPLNLSINALGDANGDYLAADTNNSSLTVAGSTVNAVPIPASWLLFASGMLGMGALNKRLFG